MPLTPPLTGYSEDPFVEEPVQCSLMLKPITGESKYPCPNVAQYDAFVNCAREHRRTQQYCERCHNAAISGSVDCRECRAENPEGTDDIRITVEASISRNNP